MRHGLWLVLLVSVLIGLSGCCASRCGARRGCGLCGLYNGGCVEAPGGCESCGPADPGGCATCAALGRGAHCGGKTFTPGPPTAAVTYPYYTLHGPRDFLQRQPSPLGP